MPSRWKLATLTVLTILCGRVSDAQVPSTPAGHQLSEWLRVQDSLDPATMQEFIEKYMPFARVEGMLANRKQTGGFDIKRVQESSDTRIVVLAQARATQQFVTITLSVAPTEPHAIAGIQLRPTEPPADLAPPKLTPTEAAAARNGAPFRQFSAWLEAFNAGDRSRMSQFIKEHAPFMQVDGQMNFRERTGGLELRALERATATTLTGLVQERDSDQFGRFTIVVEASEPYRITQLPIQAIPRPAGFELPPMTDAEVVGALRDRLTKDAAADSFSGVALVAKRGTILFDEAYGNSDREKKTANTIDTRFRLGSMNKMFTAVAVLQLVQAGKIALTDPFGKYVPDYPNAAVATKVTIHHLLTHTGGTGDFFGPEYNAHRLELRSLNDYVALFGKRDLEFEPGSRWAYSNYGFLLLGVIIERVSGQTYYDYVADHIYTPAMMTRSGSEPESATAVDRSIGYQRTPDGRWVPNTDTLPYRGTSAGGGYSTAGDLLRFAAALTSHKLLSAEYTDLLITGKVESGPGRKYAYGFEDGRQAGEGAVGHSGGAPGMNADLRIYPKSGYVVVVLSNFGPPAAQREAQFLQLRLR
ncbi:MAG TPA: serine hydrolase domain-containing protein [Vicinamibacterales bacterium]|jgi:CubicO group peptidase (beta-lactamase class C family)